MDDGPFLSKFPTSGVATRVVGTQSLHGYSLSTAHFLSQVPFTPWLTVDTSTCTTTCPTHYILVQVQAVLTGLQWFAAR